LHAWHAQAGALATSFAAAVQHIGHTLSGIAGGIVAVLVVLDGADLDHVHSMTAGGSITALVFIISETRRRLTVSMTVSRLVDARFGTCPIDVRHPEQQLFSRILSENKEKEQAR